MKKISEWLELIPDNYYRDRAIENFKKQKIKDMVVSDMSSAIYGAFDWKNSAQEFKFWNEAYKHILDLYDVMVATEDIMIIAELVDHSEQMSKRVRKHNLVWNDKDGWSLNWKSDIFGKNNEEYVFRGLAFKL